MKKVTPIRWIMALSSLVIIFSVDMIFINDLNQEIWLKIIVSLCAVGIIAVASKFENSNKA